MDSKIVENHVKDVIAQLRRKLNVKDKTKYDDYGSGYASFFDCWLYRETAEFRLSPDREHYVGLVILFSRLSNHFVFLEGDKSWDKTSSGSYMPHFEMVDDLEHDEVRRIADQAIPILEHRGMNRLMSEQLSEILPDGMKPHTILAERVYRQFDALFYWED